MTIADLQQLIDSVSLKAAAYGSVHDAQQVLFARPLDRAVDLRVAHEQACDSDAVFEQIRREPIRRTELALPARSESFVHYKVGNGWDLMTCMHMQKMWKDYTNDREALLHEIIRDWNSARISFAEQNAVVPFARVTLAALDHGYWTYLNKVDRIFSMILVTSVMDVTGMQIPTTWPATFDNIINGCIDLKAVRPRSDAVVPQATDDVDMAKAELVTAYCEYVTINGNISKLAKMQLLRDTGLTLDQLNQRCATSS